MIDQVKIVSVVDGKMAEGHLTLAQAQALHTLLGFEIQKAQRLIERQEKN